MSVAWPHPNDSTFSSAELIGARDSFGRMRSAWIWLMAACAWSCGPLLAQETVAIELRREATGRPVCESHGPAGWVQVLERSRDGVAWTEVARTLGNWARYPVDALAGAANAWFRIRALPPSDVVDWKNQVLVPGDTWLTTGGVEGNGGTRWVKFTLALDEPGRVYFQDGGRFPFHYPFAVARLPGAAGLSEPEFNAAALLPTGQRFVLGAVLLPADTTRREIGLQLLGRQPFALEDVVRWLGWVRDSLVVPSGWSTYYFPTFEQGPGSDADLAVLAGRGFPASSPARWTLGDECYSAGWAFGRLRFIAAQDIPSAYAAGRLRYDDILLTDRVPAEVPVLAGTLSLEPATPNSHVALLSQSLGLPFAYVAGTEAQTRLRSWDGREILLVAERSTTGSVVKVLEVEGWLTADQRTRLEEARRPAKLAVTPMAVRGKWHLSVQDLTAADGQFVGGKAANFGVLARAVPDNVPTPALAFTFDLWNAFLDQTGPGGATLRARLADRLRAHTFPPDPARLVADLAAVRSMIRDEADFGPTERAAILAALAHFPPRTKIRFRSSTNVEDSEQFSGAGLYDSYSGCALDDTDADASGPSACDPEETEERGVFRALRRVYASFYNDNAFLERLRRGVDESTVGMAVLVHPSFPDEIELANGVATWRVTRGASPEAFRYAGEWVSQWGAVSVSNPAGNARPERIAVRREPGTAPSFTVEQRSSLVPLGGTVMGWPDDYRHLFELLHPASVEFARGFPERSEFALDFEYKRVAPGKLVVKQVREIPGVVSSPPPPPFTLNPLGRLVGFQHHGKELHANHRLKSVWEFQSLVFPGAPGSAALDYFTTLQRYDGTQLRRVQDRFSQFSNAVLRVAGKTLDYSWFWPEGPLQGNYRLVATFARDLNRTLLTPLSDALEIQLSATYATPQVNFDAAGQRSEVRTEQTRLVPLEKIIEGNLARRAVATQGKVRIEVDYTLAFLKFGAPGIGIFDTKSFPLTRWRGTKITGLTSQPLILLGEFSQTYDSSRHNFVETFLFEPALEPGVDPVLLEELRAANVRRVRLDDPSAFPEQKPRIWLWGWDDQLREAK